MQVTKEMIEAGALAMANFDASLVGAPILETSDEFRFDSDRDEYIRRSTAVLKAAFGGLWRPVESAIDGQEVLIVSQVDVELNFAVAKWIGAQWVNDDLGMLYSPYFFTQWTPLPTPPKVTP